MTALYGKSPTGSDANNGLGWATAQYSVDSTDGLSFDDNVGDVIYLSQSHAETTTAALVLAWAGTEASPTRIICANDGAEPPTASANTAEIATTGNANITLRGFSHYQGVNFKCGDAGNAPLLIFDDTYKITAEDCTFQLRATGSLARIRIGSASSTNVLAADVEWRNADVKFANASQGISNMMANFRWFGGALMSGGTSPTALFPSDTGTGRAATYRIEGIDLTNASAGINICAANTGGRRDFVITRSILPTSWSGSLCTGTVLLGEKYAMYNCVTAAGVKVRLRGAYHGGTLSDETTIVRTGGASDDGVAISQKLVTTANAEYPHIALDSEPIKYYCDSSGSPITLYVEVCHDSQGSGASSVLTNADAGLRAVYPGGVIETTKADVLATATAHTNSSETWTTTGMTTPLKQYLAVTFTPAAKGDALIFLRSFGASKTIYMCPKVRT